MSEPSTDEHVMSFGDHLEDLRKRMIHAMIGTVVIVLVTTYYGDHIVAWLQQPLHHAQRQGKGQPPGQQGLHAGIHRTCRQGESGNRA